MARVEVVVEGVVREADTVGTTGAGLFPVFPNRSGMDCLLCSWRWWSCCNGAACDTAASRKSVIRSMVKRVEDGSLHHGGSFKVSSRRFDALELFEYAD